VRKIKPWPWMPPRSGLRLVTGAATEPDDCELVRGLCAGEPWAFRATWNRYAALVYGMMDRALGSATESEDLAQDVFLMLFRAPDRLRNPAALRSFLCSSAIRRLRSHLRAKRVRRILLLLDPTTLSTVAARSEDSEAREALNRFYDLLDTLGAVDRIAYTLRHFEGLKLEEIASVTATSLATVKRRLHRASVQIDNLAKADPDLVSYFTRRGGVSDDQ
jgi:RNA polymerase sigma-70 factor, ECF subfamily